MGAISIQNGDSTNLAASARGALVAAATRLAVPFADRADAIDRDGGWPDAELAALDAAGLLAAPLPARLGGASLGMTANDPESHGSTIALLRVLAEVGRGNLAVGRLYEGHVNALLLIRLFAAEARLAAWAVDCRRGQIFGVWNTQTTEGLRQADGPATGLVELRGCKTFASGAGRIGRPVVTAQRHDGSWQMVVVPAERVTFDVDTSRWQPLGMRATASHHVRFDGARLDAEGCLLGVPGDYYREPWFSSGAIRFAAVQWGGARALLDATVRTLRELGRTDDPYQRARVGSMAVAIESGRQWLRAAAEVADGVVDAGDRRAVGRSIAHAQMTRTAVESLCQEVLRLAEQSVGARGLLRPHPIERIGRDLPLYLRQPGPDVSLAQVGRACLEEETPAATFDLQA